MEDKKINTLFEEIKDEVSNYVSKRIELAKLQGFAKGSKAMASVAYTLFIFSCVVFALGFILITLAVFLGEEFGRMSIGFAIVSGLTLLVVIVALLAKKSFIKRLTNIVVALLMDEDK